MYKPRGVRVPTVLLAILTLIAVYAAFVWPRPLHGAAESLSFQDDFDSGALHAWEMPFPEDWEILQEDSLHYLHMKRPQPPGVPRRPLQFARLKGVKAGSFTLNAKVRRAGGSMIIVFNYVDTLHFYYVHLSKDPGTQIAVHNGIFIVDGGDRRRIAARCAPQP